MVNLLAFLLYVVGVMLWVIAWVAVAGFAVMVAKFMFF